MTQPIIRRGSSHACSLLLGTILTCTGTGCGASKAFTHKKGGSSTADPLATAGSSDAVVPGTQISLQLTASYTPRPLDVVIIRDGSSHNYLIDTRLNASLPLLSARLWNLAGTLGSVHVGVFDHFYNGKNQDPSKPVAHTATPINDSNHNDLVLQAETMPAGDFNASLGARVATAGGRGGEPRPATVLTELVKESQKPGGGDVAKLLREDAFWSILYVGATLNPNDPVDQDDVLAAVAGHKAGFEVSALTLDKGGCAFADVKSPQQANPNNDPQRNLELKMQLATHGIFGSVCDATYGVFMDDYAQHGTGSAYFQVQLPGAVVASSLKLSGPSGEDFKEFRYLPGATSLDVSTLITPGEKFVLSATLDTPPPTSVISTDQGDPAVPLAKQ